MKNIFKIILSVTFVAPQFANAAVSLISSETDSLSWHQATVLSIFATPDQTRFIKVLVSSPRPEKLPVRIWKTSSKRKGLVLLLPGTGANSDSSQAAIFADVAARQGFDTVIVADPFSPGFQNTFSKDRAVGFPHNDSAETIAMLHKSYEAYVQRYGAPNKIYLAGLSLGGMYAFRFANAKLPFKVERYLAVNPPVDLGYAIEQLDKAIRVRLDQEEFSLSETIIKNLLPIADLTWIRGTELEAKTVAQMKALLSDSELTNMGLIGTSFQNSLITISLGLRKTKAYADIYKQRVLERQLSSMTFGKYMGIVGMIIDQSSIRGKTFDQLMSESDLRIQIDNAPDKSKLFLITSADDFLLQPGDLEDLDNRLGAHMQVLKSGGHCGEIWTAAFYNSLSKVLN